MKELFKRNYAATVKRGQISENTKNYDFTGKIDEEQGEFEVALHESNMLNVKQANFKTNEEIEDELSDIMIVCSAFAIHHKIDIEKAIERKVIFNENRKD
jgi:NTP pyrophosphatase (non-canonical NTP hydrolase)